MQLKSRQCVLTSRQGTTTLPSQMLPAEMVEREVSKPRDCEISCRSSKTSGSNWQLAEKDGGLSEMVAQSITFSSISSVVSKSIPHFRLQFSCAWQHGAQQKRNGSFGELLDLTISISKALRLAEEMRTKRCGGAVACGKTIEGSREKRSKAASLHLCYAM